MKAQIFANKKILEVLLLPPPPKFCHFSKKNEFKMSFKIFAHSAGKIFRGVPF
jgi:hypothetical protein